MYLTIDDVRKLGQQSEVDNYIPRDYSYSKDPDFYNPAYGPKPKATETFDESTGQRVQLLGSHKRVEQPRDGFGWPQMEVGTPDGFDMRYRYAMSPKVNPSAEGALFDGLGQVRVEAEKQVAAALKPGVINKLFRTAANTQAKLMLAKQAMIAKQMGMSPQGMGHIMGSWEAIKTGVGPWYSPGEDHNKKHRDGTWPDLSQHSASDIAKVKELNGLSQYEVEHMDTTLFEGLLRRAKAGIAVAPNAEPLQPPLEAANDALKESIGGKALLVGEEAARATKNAISTVYNAAKGASGLIKWLPWIALGVGAVVAIPYLARAKKGLTTLRGT